MRSLWSHGVARRATLLAVLLALCMQAAALAAPCHHAAPGTLTEQRVSATADPGDDGEPEPELCTCFGDDATVARFETPLVPPRVIDRLTMPAELHALSLPVAPEYQPPRAA